MNYRPALLQRLADDQESGDALHVARGIIRLTTAQRAWGFKSKPPVAGGRCFFSESWCFISCGFNPRPPLPGGDALQALGPGFAGLAVSIHAPVAGGRCPISRNYREQKAKTAVLREPPAFRAENILLESTSKLKRQEIQRLAARANLPGKCRSLDVRAKS